MVKRSFNMTSENLCPGCKVAVGEPHVDGCFVEQCSHCLHQRLSCECTKHDPLWAAWDGNWPGQEISVRWKNTGKHGRPKFSLGLYERDYQFASMTLNKAEAETALELLQFHLSTPAPGNWINLDEGRMHFLSEGWSEAFAIRVANVEIEIPYAGCEPLRDALKEAIRSLASESDMGRVSNGHRSDKRNRK